MTRAEFHRLADVPPEAEWFANLDNPNTRRAYKNNVGYSVRADTLFLKAVMHLHRRPFYWQDRV